MQGSGEFKVIFRGVRGSYPVPGASTLTYGGNTTCHELQVGGRRLIMDAGTGIISLGYEMAAKHIADKQPMHANIFFSHVHHDHTLGLLFFKPAYFKTSKIALFGPKTFAGNVSRVIREICCDPYHPVQLDEMGMDYSVVDLIGGEVIRIAPGEHVADLLPEGEEPGDGDIIIRTTANYRHTKLGVMHFRVEYAGKSYVFATDVETTEKGDGILTEFSKGADLLAHDAQYTTEEYLDGTPPKKGWGHSTYRMACDTAINAGVKRLAIIHHDPERTDEQLAALEIETRKMFENSFFAREGMVVEL